MENIDTCSVGMIEIWKRGLPCRGQTAGWQRASNSTTWPPFYELVNEWEIVRLRRGSWESSSTWSRSSAPARTRAQRSWDQNLVEIQLKFKSSNWSYCARCTCGMKGQSWFQNSSLSRIRYNLNCWRRNKFSKLKSCVTPLKAWGQQFWAQWKNLKLWVLFSI